MKGRAGRGRRAAAAISRADTPLSGATEVKWALPPRPQLPPSPSPPPMPLAGRSSRHDAAPAPARARARKPAGRPPEQAPPAINTGRRQQQMYEVTSHGAATRDKAPRFQHTGRHNGPRNTGSATGAVLRNGAGSFDCNKQHTDAQSRYEKHFPLSPFPPSSLPLLTRTYRFRIKPWQNP